MRRYKRLSFPSPEGRCRWRRMAHRCLASCLAALAPDRWTRRAGPGETGGPRSGVSSLEVPSSRGQHHSGGQASPFQRLAGQLDRRTRSFRQALAVPQGQAEGPEVSGFELASFLALRFIPAAGSLGRWDLAAGEAARCLRLLAAGQAVAGAPAYLPLLAVPVLWSLSFTYPDLQEGGALPAARADRLRRAWSITELFQALGPPANAPPSVSFAAGALAAVLGAPSAGAWVEEGHRRAQEHGAWGFAHFFAPLVTAQGLDPSGE